ncbi:MAG: amidohydrolase family protein [Burkholderiaceae bacterium]|nr:amidohydrolase family protein [Burkholderiaceae bacterium]
MLTPPPTHPQLLAGRDEPILDPDLPIVDSHIHLFDRPPLRYLLDEYLADARSGHRVVASVYVETQSFARSDGPEMLRPLGEIEFANGLGAMADSGVYGECRVCAGIVGHADLRFGDAIGEYLDQALALAPRRFRGIRQVTIEPRSEAAYRYITHRPPTGVMQHPRFHDGMRQVQARGLVFDASVFHHQILDLAHLADAFTETPFVLNHMGLAVPSGDGEAARRQAFAEWHEAMRELAQRPNVVVKVGGLGLPFWGFGFHERTDPIGHEELAAAWRPFVETTLELFGATRCMVESNFPPDGRSAGFVPLLNALKLIVRNSSAQEKAALFHDTAVRTYRLNLQPASATSKSA